MCSILHEVACSPKPLTAAPGSDKLKSKSRFGFASPTQTSNALLTTKRMFGRALRDFLAEYAGDDDDALVKARLAHLFRILGQAGAG
jgi:hypothetical protein